jgi:O-acetyl-ADP-ribose deacetylase (regulator of RNase III)
MITELGPGEIIVIGSNAQGLHAGGAARYAHDRFGLRWGIGEGLSGQTYALPAMEGPALLRAAVRKFIDYAERSHDLTFLLTKIGCGIAGYPEEEISALFADAPPNVLRPDGWPAATAPHPQTR